MIQQVKSFKSSDGMLHATKSAALEREFQIDLRGIVQRSLGNKAIINLNATEVANLIKTNSKIFVDTCRKYQEAIRRANPPVKA